MSKTEDDYKKELEAELDYQIMMQEMYQRPTIAEADYDMIIQSEPKTRKDFEEILMKAGVPKDELERSYWRPVILIMEMNQKALGGLKGLTLEKATIMTDILDEGSLLN